VISARVILHFGKSGLGFLDILSLQFFSLEGQLHVGREAARVNRRRREKGRTCERDEQAARVEGVVCTMWYGTVRTVTHVTKTIQLHVWESFRLHMRFFWAVTAGPYN
jgi:hypothetical protein